MLWGVGVWWLTGGVLAQVVGAGGVDVMNMLGQFGAAGLLAIAFSVTGRHFIRVMDQQRRDFLSSAAQMRESFVKVLDGQRESMDQHVEKIVDQLERLTAMVGRRRPSMDRGAAAGAKRRRRSGADGARSRGTEP